MPAGRAAVHPSAHRGPLRQENRSVAPPPAPWPRLSDSWWVYALAGVAVVVFPVSLVVQVRCGLGRCTGSFVDRVFALDAIGGLPRLFTTGLFVAVAALGVLAVR